VSKRPKPISRSLARLAADKVVAHQEGADADAGFDGGEFSAPEHGRALSLEIAELAATHGVDEEALWSAAFEHVQQEA